MRIAVPALATLAIISAAVPAWADVIPSDEPRAAATESTHDAVKAHLITIGVDPTRAETITAQLNSSEREYFAAHPSSMAMSGQEQSVFWYEWVLGTAAIVATGVIVYSIIDAT